MLIPPLERIFNLVGADVQQWFAEMPKVKNIVWDTVLTSPSKRKKPTVEDEDESDSPGKQWEIEEHFENIQCLACGQPAFGGMYHLTASKATGRPLIHFDRCVR